MAVKNSDKISDYIEKLNDCYSDDLELYKTTNSISLNQTCEDPDTLPESICEFEIPTTKDIISKPKNYYSPQAKRKQETKEEKEILKGSKTKRTYKEANEKAITESNKVYKEDDKSLNASRLIGLINPISSSMEYFRLYKESDIELGALTHEGMKIFVIYM